MQVEIPDPQVIAYVIIAFVVGIFGMMIYSKIKSLTAQKTQDPAYLSRLEYYERQLIDMKIRLDAMDLEESEFQAPFTDKSEPVLEKKIEVKVEKEPEEVKIEPVKSVSKPRMPNMGFEGIAEHVLGLITTKEMTSRDIQITIGRSREHTSRLMKRLFEEGLVQRNNKTKPFTYQITEKGKAKLGNQEQPITA
ncbi:MAG: MarR family transcriptional regulator [Nitrososphaeria archaeon]|nr:MarR family transcriptional regulator [Nitrososphaeria archaeon]NDB88214.1 MarR family transcriptional regulator [Nitrososphaerota archaeon]NDF27008.1 MarR family transcriptional regulator [Nitrosopumilaceae archaeon]NDF29816.1 MarR family transcriptional regulator [Nitrososphaeria archaeon]NDF35175.1 MarR family transcriptional regulator [Nitrosopumilaceae archaeon]